MFIRVKFCDNDFSVVVKKACESLMSEISRGYSGEEALSRYKEVSGNYGLEAVRKAIILAAYGYYIANRGIKSFHEKQQNIFLSEDDKDTLTYLNENISIEEIKNFTQEWENSEVCYIDFYTDKVYLQ